MLTCRRGAFVPPPPSSSASSQSQSQPSSQSQLRPPHSNMYPNALSALLAEDSPVPSMLSEAQRPPADPSGATENLLMLAIQERLQNQLRPTANLFNHQLNLNQTITQDANRLFQQMLPLLGLPPILPGLPNPLDLGCLPGTSMTHPLWQHNLCAWPECNHPCENLAVFLTHLSQAHTFNERSTSDMRVQVELVDSLEHRLTKERNRLQAMMQHLHMKQSPDTTTPTIGKIETNTSPLLSPKQEPAFSAISSLPTQSAAVQSSLPSVSLSISEAATTPLSIPAPSVVSSEGSPTSGDQQSQKPFVPRRSRISDKSVLPISADIARNRDFYRTNDVRPPYTYASLIRQAIMESPDCQLTLNEIYTWFTETFAYFRRNAATWKNAVRHNLSLHKCFQRVEQNVKGAVWTVDDSEFYRRRPQRTAATRSQPNTPLPEEMLAQRLIDQTALSMMENRADGTGHLVDNALLNGGLEGVLSFLASSGDGNPLSLLSAAAAASEQSSCAVTPNLLVKDEPRDAPMEIDAMAQATQMQNHLNGRLGVFMFASISQLQ
ncbi:hypothetical protein Y032_0191g1299 [Ancylostoma ceylanicum]|uniref:Fork-head domain-containing protein n=1 Tax=Ancylostoma ceylanicum TaxID=53326 RepID=A0A016SQI6_9BILA|nr:hypothetical protein Y032_0191g1299 [Ancylostoma ceylanicum]